MDPKKAAERAAQIPHPGFTNVPTAATNDYNCPHCNQVCFDPIVPLCGHQHCRKCAEKLSACALCPDGPERKPWSPSEWETLEQARHRALRQAYARVLVKCNACEAMVPRGYNGDLFDDHILHCPYACPLCGEQSDRKHFAEHEMVCINYVVHCKAEQYSCPWKGPRMDLPDHEANCPFAKVTPSLDSVVAKTWNSVEKMQEELAEVNERMSKLEDSILSMIEPCIELIVAMTDANALVEEEEKLEAKDQVDAMLVRIKEKRAASFKAMAKLCPALVAAANAIRDF